MNNKGFMMAEVIVVSSIVLIALVGLYVSYNNIFMVYNKRVDYYDVALLYELANIRDTYKEEIEDVGSTGCVINETNREVYYLAVDEISDMFDSGAISNTFIDYLEYLATSLETDADNILVMEKCASENDCKYAYLEVYDET